MAEEQGSGTEVLGMFVRRPEPGKTKTRLAATVGNDVAAELYAAFVEDLLARCPNLAGRTIVAVTPRDKATTSWFQRRLAERTMLMDQPAGDLGNRIDWFFNAAANEGADRIVLIGSDSPDLPADLIAAAFQELGKADVVIGPATDGGYVLIGMRKPHDGLFQRIRWSTAMTLFDTIQAARQRGLSVKLLAPWYDIDVVENLGTLKSLQDFTASGRADCPATVRVLEKHWEQISKAVESQ